jgi:hypothetical protein
MPNRAAKSLFKLSLAIGLSGLLVACHESAPSQNSAIPKTPKHVSEPSKPLTPLPTVLTQPAAVYAHAGVQIEAEVKQRYGSPTFLQFVELVNGTRLQPFKQNTHVYLPNLLNRPLAKVITV